MRYELLQTFVNDEVLQTRRQFNKYPVSSHIWNRLYTIEGSEENKNCKWDLKRWFQDVTLGEDQSFWGRGISFHSIDRQLFLIVSLSSAGSCFYNNVGKNKVECFYGKYKLCKQTKQMLWNTSYLITSLFVFFPCFLNHPLHTHTQNLRLRAKINSMIIPHIAVKINAISTQKLI